MFTEILSDTAGQSALSRFFTTNTWAAVQTFSVAPVFSAGFTSTGLGQCTASTQTTPGLVARSAGTIAGNPPGYGGSHMAGQFIGAESSAFGYTMFESAGNAQGHAVAFRASRGTYSARTACLSSDILGLLDFGGYTGAGTFVNGKAVIRGVATEAWSTTANGTQLEFYLTANGTTASTLQFQLTSFGAIFTNDVIAPYFQVNRPAGSSKPILFRSSGSTRWNMQATGGTESGGNVGADWALDAHTDAGAYNFTALAISRSGGNATFYNLVTAPQLRVSTSNPPASATATGTSGMIRWDANYIYVCTATDTWKRVAIATWV